jgi:hypothetical protein
MSLRNYHWAVICGWWVLTSKPNRNRDDDFETACKGGIVFW